MAQDKFRRAEFLPLSISSGGSHGANQNSISIRDGGHDVVGELVLDLECARVADLVITDFAVIRLRPELRAVRGVHQLRAHSKGAASSAYASLDHIARAQFTAHRADIGRAAFVSQRRIAGDNLKIGKSRKPRG